MEKQFRVLREVQYPYSDTSGEVFASVVWSGDNPDEYTEGLGCFDEGDEIISRFFQECDNGVWIEPQNQ